ncbi:RBR-type E3 ubiquitin transferase [Mycena chlorophos]|uniref:RBR-type E3 ubiquitin transferase n=1 Tax=Mycena chlorophos TaxID=658473 RepID=A0A8H6THD6_MYCCL|nr:RBR-type E3 ubiquitin transferase [Mycena chlorophos]
MSAFLDNVDAESAALMQQLLLEDIDAIQSATKGKGRATDPPIVSNEECALHALAEDTRLAIQYLQDLEMARSIDHALELDQPVLAVLSTLEEGAEDDHRYAQALDSQQPLPPQSEVQMLMEDPHFAALSRDVADAPTAPDGAEVTADSDDGELQVARPSASSAILPVRPTPGRQRVPCIICHEQFHSRLPFSAPCGHFYCPECLGNLARACIGDESLYPLKCCRQPMPMDGVFAQLGMRLALEFRRKVAEFGTPANDRIYCPTPTCSAFLGSSANQPSPTIHCRACTTDVCVACKERVHPGQRCGENAALEQVKALARAEGWQTCPGCNRIIELHQGCFHMTCHCGVQFCYVCAVPWKRCECPQWEEQRLLNTAEQRVENEMGARARVIAPERFQARVQERVRRLRYDHDCADGHRWRRVDGRQRCEECRFTLPEYLLHCRNCGIAACVRCARNRL